MNIFFLMNYLLAGNPNTGKTTLFNALTGAKERISNRAGVTVEIKRRKLRGMEGALIDLPGIYSLSPQSKDEQIAAEAIAEQQPDVIVNIVDATNVQRNLFLTTQLMELGIPMVIALNMCDEARKKGIRVDAKELSRRLNVAVVPISARSGEGLGQLKSAMKAARAVPTPLCRGCSARHRYGCIEGVTKAQGAKASRLDRLLTHRIVGFPIFIAVMALVFYLTFDSLGAYLSDLSERLGAGFSDWVRLLLSEAPPWLRGLITDGILNGVTGVLTFLPEVALLFGLLSLLEDCGYLSRAAFITDSLMRKIGLDGKAFVPLVMGFGCTVPAVLAARTLSTASERKRTLMILPFLPCSAKLPVFGLMAKAFFPTHRGLVVLALYLIGILTAVSVALLMRNKATEQPFIMELPPYRVPTLKNTWIQLADRTGHFLFRAGTVILAVSALLWVLMHFTPNLSYTEQTQSSILGYIGTLGAPLFEPLGFGFWQAAVALLVGLVAKEAVLSSLLLFYGGSIAALTAAFDPTSAFCFMIFILLYPPCFAAIITLNREYKDLRCSAFTLLAQPLIAYAACCLFRLLVDRVF